jgi:hypothetical protein
MTTTATETTTWSGWWRKGTGHPWRRVVRDCPDSGTAWSQLLARKDLPGGDLMVSRGTDPNFPVPRERDGLR